MNLVVNPGWLGMIQYIFIPILKQKKYHPDFIKVNLYFYQLCGLFLDLSKQLAHIMKNSK